MIITADRIVPITRATIRDGYVRFKNGRIQAIGRQSELGPDVSEPITRLDGCVLLPGLINPHTHLELTRYAGRIPSGPFWSWIRGLVELRTMPGAVDTERAAVVDGAWQSLRAGVTCVGDISRQNIAWSALKPLPIRKVCYVELLTLADSPPRSVDELQAALAAVQPDERLTVGVSPHAPYSVPGPQIIDALRMAGSGGLPWCTHWAETREEMDFFTRGATALPEFLAAAIAGCKIDPQRPAFDYLRACLRESGGGARSAGLIAHGNYAAGEDFAVLAELGVTVAYCPRAHAFFGHTAYPLGEYRRHGVPVTLGTDSAASNVNLNLLEELRHVRQNIPDPPSPIDLLRMVTVDAAAALGVADRVGSLAPGRCADLAAFPLSPDADLADLIDQAPLAQAVWVGGDRVI